MIFLRSLAPVKIGIPPHRLKRSIRLARILVGILVFVASTIWLQDRTSKPGMTQFNPTRMGQLEALMWRSYYEGRWASLAWHGMQLSCGEYGFSWWDGGRASWHAALAALHFRTDTDDPRCLPRLEDYYRIIKEASGQKFDIAEAARLELEWWRERRRHVPTSEYAKTIAQLTALIYEEEVTPLIPPSEKRAAAMAYRDTRGKGLMKKSDWEEVARQLEAAYTGLKEVVAPKAIE